MSSLIVVGFPVVAAGQDAQISGHVVESGTRRPLQGARVTVAESGASVITDRDGHYRISRGSTGQELLLRAILLGYSPVTAKAPPGLVSSEINFEMTRRALGLDEIVVTGTAGPTRVREVGHSIAQIDPSRIPESAASMDQLLAGRVPGLVLVQNTAMAGSGDQIRLRGNASVSLSNQPLIYVDGVRIRSDGYPRNIPRTGDIRRGVNDVPSPLNDINPDDVERVEIVRGPAATTLYGTEAATGVIQIFTKWGAIGKPLWSSQVALGGDRVQAFGTASQPYMRIDPWLKTAQRTAYSLGVGGGNLVRYYVSGRYDRNEGVLPNDLEKRLVLRGNFDFSPADRLTLAWSSSFTTNEISNTPAGFNAQGLVMNAYRGDKNFTGVPGKESLNRILAWDLTTSLHHLVGGLTATYAATDRFSHSVTLGYDRAEDDMHSLRPYGFVFAPQGILWNDRWTGTTLTADYLGRLGFSVGHDMNATLAWGVQSIRTDKGSVAGYAEGFAGPGEPTLSSGALTLAFEDRARTITNGAFSQVVLDLRNRYFVTAGIRLDGSSSFGRDFGLQPYPRVSASYVISDEPFWPRSLGTMKLRAAYGRAGRSPRSFDAERTWSPAGYDGKPAYLPLTVGNPLLGPERTAETEVGFDAASSGSRLHAEVTFYRRNTSDALLPVTQPPSLGFIGTQLENVGALRNTGAELSVSGSLLRGHAVSLDAGLDVSVSSSRVVRLGRASSFVVDQTAWIIEGQPMLLLRGPRVTNPSAIEEPVVEQNHVFGPNFPTHTIGLRTSLGFVHGIELAGRVEYSGGNYLFDQASNHLARQGVWPVCDEAYANLAAGHRELLSAWQRLWCNPATVPRDGSIYPGDFLRLRALTLTVPLPGGTLRTRRASLVVSGRNYLLWKKKGMLVFDPEMVGFDGIDGTVRQIDMHVPPPAGVSIAIRASYW